MASDTRLKTQLGSEIGQLEGVILHQPGSEVQNMTPQNAERALYSDILNLSVAGEEYKKFNQVLNKFTKTFQVKSLLTDILSDESTKRNLVSRICAQENAAEKIYPLLELENAELARQLIEGVVMVKDTLTKFLDPNRYSLRPLHNFFFTRDASVAISDEILICKMANDVRDREAVIMEAIFDHHHFFETTTVNPRKKGYFGNNITIEGGDVLVIREDILLVGSSARTTSQGIDYILDELLESKKKRYLIVQEMPHKPESFIHLDMAFTMLDEDKCMIFEPLITRPNKFQTVQLEIDNGKVKKISNVKDIMEALKNLGMDLEPVLCGGNNDQWVQEREQWHSGANFFAVGPGKVIGYERNNYTIEEMHKHGFEILTADQVINDKVNMDYYKKFVVTIPGSELARGGGGCRCMTMPIRRKTI
jgi:arginine deiminase